MLFFPLYVEGGLADAKLPIKSCRQGGRLLHSNFMHDLFLLARRSHA